MKLLAEVFYTAVALGVAVALLRDTLIVLRRGETTWRPRFGSKTFRYDRVRTPLEFWLLVVAQAGFAAMLAVYAAATIMRWLGPYPAAPNRLI